MKWNPEELDGFLIAARERAISIRCKSIVGAKNLRNALYYRRAKGTPSNVTITVDRTIVKLIPNEEQIINAEESKGERK